MLRFGLAYCRLLNAFRSLRWEVVASDFPDIFCAPCYRAQWVARWCTMTTMAHRKLALVSLYGILRQER